MMPASLWCHLFHTRWLREHYLYSDYPWSHCEKCYPTKQEKSVAPVKTKRECPYCHGPLAEGSFIAHDGDFVLDAWHCTPCKRVYELNDLEGKP